MKVLVITNLFPNKQNPQQAVFNKQQMVALSKINPVKVIAPVPYFKYSQTDVPQHEVIEGIDVYHPRYLVIPKIMRFTYGFFYHLGIKAIVRKIQKDFDFDCIFATWAYPDAYAAAQVAQELRKPVVVKVHGTDINVIAQDPLRRSLIRQAFDQATHVIAVSRALKGKIMAMGIPQEKIILVQNGVNTELFSYQGKALSRERLKIPADRRFVVYVGNLEPIKGVDLLLDAMEHLPADQHLYYIGEGSLKGQLMQKAQDKGWQERVHFLGRLPHQELPRWMSAADSLCLPSRHEGCPNVILEAMACKVPVVGTNVGGIPDLLENNVNGFLVEPNNPKALAEGITKVVRENFLPNKMVHAVSWTENARAVNHILTESVRQAS